MMQVAKDRAVAVEYQLTLDSGVLVDASEKGDPLWFICGRGQLLPQFEKELQGLSIGDTKKFSLKPEEGYGKLDPNKIIDIKKDQLSADNYVPGATIRLRSPNGQQAEGRILSIDKATIKVDFNHELAGQNLHFDIRVAEIRAATKEELIHGDVHSPGHEEHVHGPGCHH